jgi:hypothetical protein
MGDCWDTNIGREPRCCYDVHLSELVYVGSIGTDFKVSEALKLRATMYKIKATTPAVICPAGERYCLDQADADCPAGPMMGSCAMLRIMSCGMGRTVPRYLNILGLQGASRLPKPPQSNNVSFDPDEA